MHKVCQLCGERAGEWLTPRVCSPEARWDLHHFIMSPTMNHDEPEEEKNRSRLLSPACMHSTHLARQGPIKGVDWSTLAHTYIGTPAATKGLLLMLQIHPFRLHLLSPLSPQQSSTYPTTYLNHISSHL